jgi:hypothetical protein
MNTKKHYRQGDVLMKRVDSLPKKGLTKVPRVNGRIIVALGTSNGNPHYIDDKASVQFRDETGNLHYNLIGISIKGKFPIVEQNKLRVIVNHPKLGKVAFSHSDLSQTDGVASISGRFTLLKHGEHDVHAILEGNHNQEPQRGYNRGEIRRVQD